MISSPLFAGCVKNVTQRYSFSGKGSHVEVLPEYEMLTAEPGRARQMVLWSIEPPRVPTYHSACDESVANSAGSCSIPLAIRIAAPERTDRADDDDAPPPDIIEESRRKSNPASIALPYFIWANLQAPAT